MALANTLSIRLEAISQPFTAGINNASSALKGFLDRNRTLGDVFSNVTASIGSIHPAAALAVGGITAVGAAVLKAANTADNMLALANRAGTTVEAFSQLKFAVEQSGGSVEALTPAFRRLSQTIGAAAGGSKTARKAFADLGIGVKDLGRPIDEVFGLVADGVAKTGNAQLQLAKASKVLGLSASQLVPLLREGSKGIDALRARADRLGLTISSDFARRSDEFNDNMSAVRAALGGVSLQIGEKLLPVFAKFAQFAVDFAERNGPAIAGFFQRFGFVVRELALGFEELGLLAKAFLQILTPGEQGNVTATFARLKEVLKEDKLTFEQFIAVGKQVEPGITMPVGALGDEFVELEEKVKEVLPPLGQVAERLERTFTAAEGGVGAIVSLAAQFASLRGGDAQAGLELINSELDKAIAKGGELAEAARRAKEEIAGAVVGIEGPVIEPEIRETRRLEAIEQEVLITGPPVNEEALEAAHELRVESERQTIAFNEMTDAGLQAGSVIASAFGNIGSVIVDAATGGKRAFGDFFKQLLKQIAAAIVQALILKAIVSTLGGPLGFFGKLFDIPRADIAATKSGRQRATGEAVPVRSASPLSTPMGSLLRPFDVPRYDVAASKLGRRRATGKAETPDDGGIFATTIGRFLRPFDIPQMDTAATKLGRRRATEEPARTGDGGIFSASIGNLLRPFDIPRYDTAAAKLGRRSTAPGAHEEAARPERDLFSTPVSHLLRPFDIPQFDVAARKLGRRHTTGEVSRPGDGGIFSSPASRLFRPFDIPQFDVAATRFGKAARHGADGIFSTPVGHLLRPFDIPGIDSLASSEGNRFGMLFGRGARAAAQTTAFSGIARSAPAPTSEGGVTVRPQVKILEPGPLTKAIYTDQVVLPRLRQRQRQLGEEPL
jgi:hypothetical protein